MFGHEQNFPKRYCSGAAIRAFALADLDFDERHFLFSTFEFTSEMRQTIVHLPHQLDQPNRVDIEHGLGLPPESTSTFEKLWLPTAHGRLSTPS